jgi:flagellar motor switch protein FliN/FliY
MSKLTSDQINQLTNLQNQIWQTVSITASEAANDALTFGSPLTIATTTNDLFAEMASPKLVITFAFDFLPDQEHVLLIAQETFTSFVALATKVDEAEVSDVDDSAVSEVRPIVEAIVQGMCLAVGNIRNEPCVTTGVTTRFQVFNFPTNFEKGATIIRTNAALSSTKVNGSVIWLMDEPSAMAIMNLDAPKDAPVIGDQVSATGGSGSGGNALSDEASSLQLLMDIPLEISVELGRVRMMVKDVVDLGSGSIVEIDKAAGEPVDVLVNGRLVARGEVVVIEDNFGVRVTEILSPAERLNRLNEAA